MFGMGIIGRWPDNWLKIENGRPLKRTWTPWVNRI